MVDAASLSTSTNSLNLGTLQNANDVKQAELLNFVPLTFSSINYLL